LTTPNAVTIDSGPSSGGKYVRIMPSYTIATKL
jgi:hypothetical protein